MSSLPHRIVEYAATLPEGAPLCPSALLHLGNRAAVDQALSRLAHRGELLRTARGSMATRQDPLWFSCTRRRKGHCSACCVVG